jgi:hypothetical protein
MAVGGLIGGLSGLCTGVAFLSVLANLSNLPQFVSGIESIFYFSGVPLGLGSAIFLAGRAVGGAPSRQWIGRTAAAMGLIIVAATAYPAARVVLYGPKSVAPRMEFIFDPESDPMAPAPFAAGLVLIAAAIYELRRKPARRKADAFD